MPKRRVVQSQRAKLFLRGLRNNVLDNFQQRWQYNLGIGIPNLSSKFRKRLTKGRCCRGGRWFRQRNAARGWSCCRHCWWWWWRRCLSDNPGNRYMNTTIGHNDIQDRIIHQASQTPSQICARISRSVKNRFRNQHAFPFVRKYHPRFQLNVSMPSIKDTSFCV